MPSLRVLCFLPPSLLPFAKFSTPLTMKLSLASSVVFCLAIVSALIVALLPTKEPTGITFWVYHAPNRDAYSEPIVRWNEAHPESPFALSLLHDRAIEHRMISGFLSGTPMADLLETHEWMYTKAYFGPLDQVGFLDITERLYKEGLYEQFNEPALLKQSTRGRHFGLPLQAAPALLAYRSDLTEAAGITEADIAQIETWDDYFRVMRPLMTDNNGDGRPDRYLLNLSEVNLEAIRMLVLQNDGVMFDENAQPIFANEGNARTLATLTTWITGPGRVTIDVPTHSSSAAHKQRLDGLVVGSIITDWMLNLWKIENPQLAGKIKLMPIPAFERGGRRTSSTGSCMISINKRSSHIEACWEMAKSLYTSREVAEHIWREVGMVTAYKGNYEAPFYHEPDPFCGGQATGTLFIEQVPNLPLTPASPYQNLAYAELVNTMIGLRAYAEKYDIYDAERLTPEALRLLQKSQTQLKKLIGKNVFLTEAGT